MVNKSDVLFFRIEPETKKRFAAAAKRKGVSLTKFALAAIERAAKEVERTEPRVISRDMVFRGVPTFFRASCQEAQSGGEMGYRHAGWNLALHVGDLAEGDSRKEIDRKLHELDGQVRAGDADAVLAWFDREFPKCMDLIPRRRRDQFAIGVRECWEEREPL